MTFMTNIQVVVDIIITALVHPFQPVVVLTLTLYIMVVMEVMKVVKYQFNNNKMLKWKGDYRCNNK